MPPKSSNATNENDLVKALQSIEHKDNNAKANRNTSVSVAVGGSVKSIKDSCHKFAGFLLKYKTDFSDINVIPRGLHNPSNYCFINAILQTLIGCSPLYNLMKAISNNVMNSSFNYDKTPAIYTL